VQCLLGWRDALLDAGIRRVRLSPVAHGFEQVVAVFDRVLNRGADAAAGLAELVALPLPGAPVDGYAHRHAGREWSLAE
jgi:hypothetical protein